MNSDKAWTLAHQIDGEGAAEVWAGPLEPAELYHQQTSCSNPKPPPASNAGKA